MQSFDRGLCRALVEPRVELRAELRAGVQMCRRADVQTCRRLHWRLIAEMFIETIVWVIVWTFD